MDNFIKLNIVKEPDGSILEINPSFIESMESDNSTTKIVTFSGRLYEVKESIEEIRKLSLIKKKFNYQYPTMNS